MKHCCENCKHWSRWHNLSQFGPCALLLRDPNYGPQSSHTVKMESDTCPKFAMPNQLFFVFDVESAGLHGEGFAVGWVIVKGDGSRVSEGCLSCPPLEAGCRDEKDWEWVKANVPPIPVTHPTPYFLRGAFWKEWLKWKEQGALLVADCAWPVEARFLLDCVDDQTAHRTWEGPYPLHDLASVLLTRGLDPLATRDRLADELPKHNPLADARQSARLLTEALTHGRC
jgi:hypothetical protein